MPQARKTDGMPRIAVILAGGGGRRIGGADKGELMLARRRLVDHVAARLSPQAERLLISGMHDYETGLTAIRDREDGPRGPAAGLWSALHWIEKHAPATEGFSTAPVDGPFVPLDLIERLAAGGECAIVSESGNAHPTFAYWRLDVLRAALESAPAGEGLALKELADKTRAQRIVFNEADAFLNINTWEDIERAEELLRG